MDAEADTVNLDFDNQHYESSNTKLIEKKMTRTVIKSINYIKKFLVKLNVYKM